MDTLLKFVSVKKAPNMVLNGKISPPYSQYPVQAKSSGEAVYLLFYALYKENM